MKPDQDGFPFLPPSGAAGPATGDGPPQPSAVFLSDCLHAATGELNDGADFLRSLAPDEMDRVRAMGRTVGVQAGEHLFRQGDPHEGIWLIESGSLRTFYTSPAGREMTLAFWTPGHFVGGPEVFGGGRHVWSASADQDSALLALSGQSIRALMAAIPAFAVCLVEGLVAKGKCYSALAQMLGTRSVAERLAHLLIIFASVYGRRDGQRLIIDRRITHEQIATVVGATRQWVTATLDGLQKKGIISVARQTIAIERPDLLRGSIRN